MSARPTILASLALTVACGFVAFEMRQRRRAEERERGRAGGNADFRAMMWIIRPLLGESA